MLYGAEIAVFGKTGRFFDFRLTYRVVGGVSRKLAGAISKTVRGDKATRNINALRCMESSRRVMPPRLFDMCVIYSALRNLTCWPKITRSQRDMASV